MRYTRIIATSVLLASFGVTGLYAQTIDRNAAPAEFPPASFQGNQYVDSTGCVFIRAGIDGNVTWVPRVSRSRQQVCGARPTLAGQAAAPAATQPAATAQPVQIVPRAAPAPRQTTTQQPMPTVATTITRRPAAAPQATQPRRAPQAAQPRRATPATVPAPRRQAPAPSPAPQPTVVSPAPQPAAPAPGTRNRGTRCPNASSFSQRYINDGSQFPVRCGPQPESPITRPGGQSSLGSGGGERILPAHLLGQRREASVVRVPEGYVPVWEDGRLNPRRAEQSVSGYLSTQYSWTNTVPRHGTGTVRQNRIKQPKIISDRPVSTRAYRPVITSRQQPTAQREVAKAERAGSASIYVQVGMYGVEANARASAQRMARTGFPTRMGTLTRGGTSYRLVMAGPFASQAEASRAMAAARRAGFSDAYIRN